MAQGKERKPKEKGGVGTAYLLLYNAVQAGGWLAVFVIMVMHLVRHPSDYAGVYDAVKLPLLIFQTAMLLEVVHAAVGLVPSSAFLTALQISSRIFVVWSIVYSFPGVRSQFALQIMVGAWAVTEVVRYTFYFCSLLKNVPYILLWCRYTFFFLLYPLGVFGEMSLIYNAFPEARASRPFTITMPNRFNFAFDFYYFLHVVLFIYVPFFPMLYLHMIQQRRKCLGAKPKAE